MPVLAVIPARLGATRLPRKPLRSLGGKPMIVRVYERVADLRVSDAIVVATDAPEVVEVCKNYSVPARLTDEFHASGTDRVAEVARMDEFAHFQIILNVQGDEPFVSHDAVAGAVRVVQSGRAEIGTCAAVAEPHILSRPDIVKVVCADDGRALYFSRAPIPFLRDNSDSGLLPEHVRQHIGVYTYTRDALMRWVSLPAHALEQIERLEQLRPLAAGMAIGVATINAMPERGIDTEDDLTWANARFEAYAATTHGTT